MYRHVPSFTVVCCYIQATAAKQNSHAATLRPIPASEHISVSRALESAVSRPP